MQVKFVKHPENDVIPPRNPDIKSPIIYELASSFTDKPNSKYWLRCHKCGLSANLGDHDVTIKDGAVTINPSIMCPNSKCDAHYWIKDGQVV